MINIQNLSFGYSGSKRNVFSQFNLQMKPGSVYGLLGKNGTGKTTLLYLLCGLLRPNSGEITIDGDVVSEMNLKSASNLNGNLNGSKELEHYASG
jgi:ABC-2 type transport system ATP-binding protein